eukprot:9349787-Alexandrium_andersonii.AAC.1
MGPPRPSSFCKSRTELAMAKRSWLLAPTPSSCLRASSLKPARLTLKTCRSIAAAPCASRLLPAWASISGT